MPDLIKTLLDLSDIMIKWILRMIPPFIAIISLLVAYYYYKLNMESFKLNDKNYFYHRGCKKINKECGFKLSKNILKCPNWICNKSEKYQNYYCFDGEKCNKKKVNVKMCKNTCGYNQIGYTPNKIYTSEDECLKNLAYKKYNKEECLTKYSNLGWFVDSEGKGQCLNGSPTGPINYTLDYKINTGDYIINYKNNVPNSKNSFQMANPNSFIM